MIGQTLAEVLAAQPIIADAVGLIDSEVGDLVHIARGPHADHYGQVEAVTATSLVRNKYAVLVTLRCTADAQAFTIQLRAERERDEG